MLPYFHPRSLGLRFTSRLRLVLLVSVLIATCLQLVSPGSAQTQIEVGYRDFSFSIGEGSSVVGISAPTGQKPQSKLWFADGYWWGVLFHVDTKSYNIHRFDLATQTWINTNTVVDDRPTSRMDCLWDGLRLYVVSAVRPNSVTPGGMRILRYTYDRVSQTYSLDSGFPMRLADFQPEATVIDKDTTGMLWVTFTETNAAGGRQVYVAHSTTDDHTWTAPYLLPVEAAAALTADDISTIVAFGNQIGVMWSEQTTFTVYFATHVDGTDDQQWTQEVALHVPAEEYADDHINVKTDGRGQVFAAVKTSLNRPTEPLVMLLKRDMDGTWSHSTFGQVVDAHTRPIVVIDAENNQIYVFASNERAIFYKQSDLDNIQFAAGPGTPFIQSSVDTNINNIASTKQTVTSTSGLLGIASDDETDQDDHYYFHNYLSDLGIPCVVTSIGTQAVNLREGPGTNFAAQGTLPSQNNAQVDGQATGNDGFVWWRLTSGLWVRSDVVTASGNCAEILTVEPVAPS